MRELRCDGALPLYQGVLGQKPAIQSALWSACQGDHNTTTPLVLLTGNEFTENINNGLS